MVSLRRRFFKDFIISSGEKGLDNHFYSIVYDLDLPVTSVPRDFLLYNVFKLTYEPVPW